ncbi:YdcF family protein [Hymenobacter aerilatus]|uniref:YdcF family protein n=1 Tax=Hymenobacter aerilatus TaxID=2932251 RepID=A0A8T9SWD5_9BACT|nr:YdcF family protein [Hymenobacter aerilatus]UOR04510.1 YdcF family protein [Hymenobacter aerilatus]
MMWRLPSALLLLMLLNHFGHGQAPPPAQRTDSVLVAKTYPLLALLEAKSPLRKIVQADKMLQRVAQRQAQRSYPLLTVRPANVQRYVDSLVWKSREIRAIGQELQRLYLANKAFKAAVQPLLGSGGGYPLYAAQLDTAALRLAWQDAAQGLNRTLRVYVASMRPRYPVIDSISFPRQDAAFAQALQQQLLPLQKRRPPASFYEVPLRAALAALRLNGRDEAARYEPLGAGLNAAPRAAVAGTEWARFPYTMILVPGMGPEQPGVALDSMSVLRCRMAAARYRAGQAPFVVVSGGHVHPNKTPFCEAVEMKKYMVGTLGLPDAAVFIEPHARHTTTNLRNVSRMLYAFGFPTDKPVLTVTDASQSRYILNMAERCRRELGYVPYRDLQRLSDTENSYLPVPEARQPNPFDPLDP